MELPFSVFYFGQRFHMTFVLPFRGWLNFNLLVKVPQSAGFEPSREDPILFLVRRLNHSAMTAWVGVAFHFDALSDESIEVMIHLELSL